LVPHDGVAPVVGRVPGASRVRSRSARHSRGTRVSRRVPAAHRRGRPGRKGLEFLHGVQHVSRRGDLPGRHGARGGRQCGERESCRDGTARAADGRAGLETGRDAARALTNERTAMDFEYSAKVKDLQARLNAFMDAHVYPNERRFHDQVAEGDRWPPTRVVEELKAKARSEGLWNLFLPQSERGAGLTNTEYAPLCEIMGHALWAPQVFNCNAPDTGNMETLERYGSPEQKKQWLE